MNTPLGMGISVKTWDIKVEGKIRLMFSGSKYKKLTIVASDGYAVRSIYGQQ